MRLLLISLFFSNIFNIINMIHGVIITIIIFQNKNIICKSIVERYYFLH